VWLVFLFVFNFRAKPIFLTSYFVLIYCLFLTIAGQEKEAQAWGDYSFFIILIGVIKYLLEFKKEQIN
jgi:hypothetical protein